MLSMRRFTINYINKYVIYSFTPLSAIPIISSLISYTFTCMFFFLFFQTGICMCYSNIYHMFLERITEEISEWKSSDEKFVQTNSSKQLLEILKKNKIVVVTGNAGIGKSVTSRHVGLHMLREGFDVLPAISPRDISSYTAKSRNTLFIFDDICGRYNVVQSESEEWNRYTSVIQNCFSISPIKILATCRQQVFQNPMLQRLELLTQCEFNMTFGKYATTVEEKRSIASVYIPEQHMAKISEESIQRYDCFPLLCSMISKVGENKVVDVIEKPYIFFEEEFEKMSITDGMKYCALLFVAVFNNKFSEKLLENQLTVKDKAAFVDIFEASKQNTNTSRSLLKDHLDILVGVYITKLNDNYSFIHAKIFDIACQYFSKTCMKCFIEHGNILLLCERFELEFSTHTDDVQRILVPVSFEQRYFYRMFDEVTENTFLDIFGCEQTKNEIFRRHFLQTLQSQDNELISLFLNVSQLGITFLHLMCEQGDLELVSFCLKKGMNKDGCDDIGLSPLHYACKSGNEYVVDLLLQAGVDVNIYKRRGFTPLYEACFREQKNIVEKLLKSGASPNLCNQRYLLPLTVSTKIGNIEITQLLLQNHADINNQNNDGIAALHEACINGNNDIVNILISHQALIDIKTAYNETPLYFACMGHHCYIIDMLISKGANLFEKSTLSELSPIAIIKNGDDVEMLNKILKPFIDKKANFIYAELENACFSSDSRYLRILLDLGIDVNRRTPSGSTYLNIACSEGYEKIAELLINTGANIHGYDQDHRNSLQLACLHSHQKIVHMLISKDVDSNYICCSSTLPTALHISCLKNDYELVSALIQSNAEVNQMSQLHSSALCEFESKELGEKSFLSKINHNTKFMLIPLEIVCMEKQINLKIINLLLENKAKSSYKSANDINPLLIACFYKYYDLVSILLKYEANVNACECVDTLCLAHMQNNGEENIIDLLSYTNLTEEISKSTPLHISSMTNSRDSVTMFLQNHAKLSIACNISPVMLAILNGNYQKKASRRDIIDYYKDLKAVINVLPLHIACLSGYRDVVETLVKDEIYYYTEAPISISPVQVACIKGHIYQFKHNRLNRYFVLTPLQIASLGHYWNICKVLMHKDLNLTKSFDVSTNLIACFLDGNTEIEASENNNGIYKTSVLQLSVQHEQYDITKYILDTIVIVDFEVGESLKSVFYDACSKGNLEIVSHLYSKIVNINNNVDANNINALYNACENCHREVAEFLISNCVCIESIKFDKEKLLHTACKTGLDTIVTLLIRVGADPLLKKLGKNAYHTASKYNQAECLSILFNFWETNIHSANTDTVHCLDHFSDGGKTVLYIAYQNRNVNFMKLVLSFGADINFTYGKKSNTLLIEACKANHIQFTQLLLENSANMDTRNNEGQTAICISCEFEQTEIVQLLLNNGANVNICNNVGLGPLYFACTTHQVDTVSLLLENHAETNVCIPGSDSLLLICCIRKIYSIVDLLLHYGADVNFRDEYDETALYKSFQMYDANLINSLLAYNADWKEISSHLKYFLFDACKKGLIEIVQIILQLDQNIDVNSALNGKTPLYACYECISNTYSYLYTSHIKTGCLLIRHGADIFLSTHGNDTPFHQLCVKGEITDIKEILQNCVVNQTILEEELTRACTNNRKELAYVLNQFWQFSTENWRTVFFSGS